jgi:biopolymer transport protein ExbD
MSLLKTNSLARLNSGVWSMALLLGITTMSAPPRSPAQAMQEGIRVELAPASSAVPVPDADTADALIITVTDTGRLYFGIDPVAPSSLAENLKGRLSHRRRNLYIKADSRAPYACVMKVLDAARSADVAGVTLLTTQPRVTQAGTIVLPEGIEIELVRRAPAVPK